MNINQDINQEQIPIPKVVYQGEDKKLQERIGKFKVGTFRIVLFTIVGMFMGWHSMEYYTDSFLLTKVILAIPYKISEAIYVTVIGTGAERVLWEEMKVFTEFFPLSPIATFLAERGTPVLIGGAIYGALAYFTGDKRVFTLNRFVKFFGIWCAVILLYIGGVYGVNAATSSMDNFPKEVQEQVEIVEITEDIPVETQEQEDLKVEEGDVE